MGWAQSSMLTYGGDQASGPYQLRAPSNRPSRLILLFASADGAATIYLGEGDDISQPVLLGSNAGNAGTGAGWRGLILPFTAGGAVPLHSQAVPAGELMTMTVKAAGGVHAYLTVQWEEMAVLGDAPTAGARGIAAAQGYAAEHVVAGRMPIYDGSTVGGDSWVLGINRRRDQETDNRDQEPRGGRRRRPPMPWDRNQDRNI